MRVLIVAVGSRGDVAPLTGLGASLRARGHDVTITGYRMFADLVTGCGLGFRALPGDPRLLEAARWRRWGAGPLGAVRLVRLIADHMRELHNGILTAARHDADVLLLEGMSAIGGYHIAEGLGLPSMGLLLQPVYPTREFPPSIVAGRSLGSLGNRAAGQALVAMGAPALAGPVKELRAELGLPRLSTREAILGRPDAHWTVFHGFSPAIVPRPADWPDGLEVVGYWWPERPAAWEPPAGLQAFLDAGPPPVFVGIGSMTPADADRLGELAAAAGRRAGVRMVIQSGQSGLARTGQTDVDSIVVGEVPHDWLFPKMAAVVHHAGAGTTASGLRAGVPAVSVPMVGDQPFWAARLAALGTGPRPIPYKRLSSPRLAAAIQDAVTHPSYRERAVALARRLASEDGATPVVNMVTRLAS